MAEKAQLAVSALAVVVGLSGMLVAMMTILNERRREMAILRSVVAWPLHVFALILGESALLTLAGVILGMGLLYGSLLAGQPLILSRFGPFIAIDGLSSYEVMLTGIVFLAGGLVGIIPGLQIYRYSLADGMTIRL